MGKSQMLYFFHFLVEFQETSHFQAKFDVANLFMDTIFHLIQY